jgi:hypothetical protein
MLEPLQKMPRHVLEGSSYRRSSPAIVKKKRKYQEEMGLVGLSTPRVPLDH